MSNGGNSTNVRAIALVAGMFNAGPPVTIAKEIAPDAKITFTTKALLLLLFIIFACSL